MTGNRYIRWASQADSCCSLVRLAYTLKDCHGLPAVYQSKNDEKTTHGTKQTSSGDCRAVGIGSPIARLGVMSLPAAIRALEWRLHSGCGACLAVACAPWSQPACTKRQLPRPAPHLCSLALMLAG